MVRSTCPSVPAASASINDLPLPPPRCKRAGSLSFSTVNSAVVRESDVNRTRIAPPSAYVPCLTALVTASFMIRSTFRATLDRALGESRASVTPDMEEEYRQLRDALGRANPLREAPGFRLVPQTAPATKESEAASFPDGAKPARA